MPYNAPHRTQKTSRVNMKLAVPLLLASAFSQTFVVFLIKLLPLDIPVSSIVFIRVMISISIIIAVQEFKGHRFVRSMKTQHGLLHIVRGTLGIGAMYLYFTAARHLPLATVAVFMRTSPFFVPIVLYAWKRKKVRPMAWLGILLGFIGVLCIFQFSFASLNLYEFCALAAAICLAGVIPVLRELSKTEPPHRIVAYFNLFGIVSSLLISFFFLPEIYYSFTKEYFLIVLVSGIFSYFYQMCFTMANQYAPAEIVGTLSYLSIIFAIILDWVFWQEAPDAMTIIGILLIVLGSSILVWYGRKQRNTVETTEQR